jgi:hypothetical protein
VHALIPGVLEPLATYELEDDTPYTGDSGGTRVFKGTRIHTHAERTHTHELADASHMQNHTQTRKNHSSTRIGGGDIRGAA